MTDLDIELTGGMDDGGMLEGEVDSRLDGLFDDPRIPSESEVVRASKKEGIKSLGGGQPRVASGDGAVSDISSIWQDAPDMSSIWD